MKNLRWISVLLATCFTLIVACGGGGGGSTPPPAAPAGLTYSSNPAVYTKGTAITANTPSSTGGAVSSYSVAPALPADLTLDAATGIISGTPSVVAAETVYTVSATNVSGNTTALVDITVNDIAITGLAYSDTFTLTRGNLFTSAAPTYSGGTATSFSIDPALPAGLAISASTGVISGTPTAVASAATYTVTANYAGGSTTTTLSLRVNDAPITGFSYTPSTVVLTKGTPFTSATPAHSGATVTSFTVSPTLPAGLAISAATGVVSGTATVAAASAPYTVTANYIGGSVTTTLTLAVNDVPVTGFSYTPATLTLTKGTAGTSSTPAHAGGTVTSFTISPALPAGLAISASTGVVSGTATVTAASAAYTVTANYLGGSVTTTLTLAVNDVPVTGFSYSPATMTLTKGSLGTSATPAHAGGTVTSFTVSPTLPAGLAINAATGVVSGTPSVLAASASYTVTANYVGASTTTSLTIVVFDAAPTSLTYTLNPGYYTVGTAIAANNPSNSGGTPTAYSVSPSLPAGLSLNTTTGVITGTPTAATASATYTVTASNVNNGTTQSTTKILTIIVYPSYLAEMLAPLSVHPSDSWMAASVPVSTGYTLLWSKTGSHLGAISNAAAQSITFPALASEGANTLSVNAQSATTSYNASGSRTINVQTGTWLVKDGGMALPVGGSTTTVLPSGRVLVAGGTGADGYPTSVAQIYDPVTGKWFTTGAMTNNREGHSATLLPNGTVLVAGGKDKSFATLKTTETYDPNTGTWTAAGDMTSVRTGFTTTLLSTTGKVLAVGGGNGGSVVATAELYDPAARTWTATGSMGAARQAQSAVLLGNGKALVIGGETAANAPIISTELFDPAAGTWSTTGALTDARYNAAAVKLFDGKVLVTAGTGNVDVLDTTEIYDPTGGTWTKLASLLAGPLDQANVTLLNDANHSVLLTGGEDDNSGLTLSELYTPGTQTWALTAQQMNVARTTHSAALLADGTVLVAGGFNGPGLKPDGIKAVTWPAPPVVAVLSSYEIFNPSNGTWTAPAPRQPRHHHTATLISSNGKVLVTGGMDPAGTPLATAQLYDPATRTWSAVPNMSVARANHTATAISATQVLVVGGNSDAAGTTVTNTAQVYDSSSNTWTLPTTLSVARKWHTATLIAGHVVIAGGNSGGASAITTTELFDTTAHTWATGNPMNTARQNHTATLLKNGSVLVAGGLSTGTTVLNTSEVFNGTTWTADGTTMSKARQFHTAATLDDNATSGAVMVIGGADGSMNALAGCDIYVPGPGWAISNATEPTARYQASAVAIPSDGSAYTLGRVLVSGGYNGGPLSDSEFYDASINVGSGAIIYGSWTFTQGSIDHTAGQPSAARYGHTLVPLGTSWTSPIVAIGGYGADGVTETFVPIP